MPIERIPLTRNGKLDRRALPAPDRAAYASVPGVQPRTPAEHRLAAIWSELLQVNEISASDNFFALGGDSIRAARLLATAQQAGLPMAMWMIYQATDLAELAALAAPRTTATEMPLTTDQLRQLAEGHQVRSTRLALSGQPDPELLAEALTAVVDHHEALRQRVTATQIMFAATGDVPFRALQVSPTEDRATVVTAAVEADRQAIDPATGPMLRATLVHFGTGHQDSGQVGAAQPELWLTTSTLALDPESLPVLITDLNTAYRQLSEARPVALPPIPVPLHQWSTRAAERAAAEDLADSAHHWLTRTPGIDLPESDQQATVTLSPEHTAALLATQRPEELLLITLGRTLTRWAGGDRIDVEVSTDPRAANPELSRTVGPLRASHPVSLWLPNRDLPSVLRSARRQLAALGNPEDYGLLRHHAPDPDLAADLADLPRPQVAFGADLSTPDTQPNPLVFHPTTADHTPEHPLDVWAALHEGRLYLRWTGAGQELAQAHLDLLAEALGEHTSSDDRTLTQLSTVVTEAMTQHAVPGAALALIRDGELAGVLAHGTLAADDQTPVTPDTLFAAGSLSKTATTVAVLRLAERGELDLDRELTQFPVTIRQLLAHTAGLAVPEDDEPLRLEHPPGEVFRVNSAHFVLLQQVLTEHTGLDFAELMRRELFEPLDMTTSTFVNPDPATVARAHDADGTPLSGGYEVNPAAAAGGLWTTAADLARLMIAIRHAYLGHPDAVLRQDLAREMLTAQSGRPYGWSAILDDSGADLEFGHGGQATGYQAMAGLRVHAGLGAVLLTNASSGRELVTRVIAAVWPSQARLTTLFQRAVDDATTTTREHGA
ncbi:serine hydrolase [Lentzea kentuckyensis]|uniref:serine hydrolase domain-containing protein n=1 Tax=Lentzea kentuckyensis TaxID=360086 RepID=UPI003CCC05C4